MPPEVDDRAPLVDMLDFAREVVDFSKGRARAELDSDRILRQAYSSIPWQDIIGMRNVIAHEYGRVDLDEIWKTARRDAPRLVSELEMIVAKLPPP